MTTKIFYFSKVLSRFLPILASVLVDDLVSSRSSLTKVSKLKDFKDTLECLATRHVDDCSSSPEVSKIDLAMLGAVRSAAISLTSSLDEDVDLESVLNDESSYMNERDTLYWVFSRPLLPCLS